MGKSMSKKLIALVASAVIIGQVGSLVQPVFANDSRREGIEFKSSAPEYINQFDGQTASSWKTIEGKGSVTQTEDDYLEIRRNSSGGSTFTVFDENAPQLSNGEVEMKFRIGKDGRFGLVTRPSNDNSYLFMGYDEGTNWKIIGADGSGKKVEEVFQGPELNNYDDYILKVKFDDKHITMTLNNEVIYDKTTDMAIPTGQGYGLGFQTWGGTSPSYVDYIRASEGTLDPLVSKEIASIDSVNISTFVRVKPVMPEKVKVTYADRTSGIESVKWDYISREQYSTPGTIEVNGVIKRKDMDDVTVVANLEIRSEPLKYALDFENEENCGQWATALGTASASFSDGKAKLDMKGASTIADINAPDIMNGSLEGEFTTSVDSGRIGIVFRYIDEKNYSSINLDAGNWVWKNFVDGKSSYGNFGSNSKALEANTTYNFRLEFEDTKVKFLINDEVIGDQTIGVIPVVPGKYGVHSWFANKIVTLDNIKFEENGEFDESNVPDDLPLEEKYIQSETMKVTLDNRYPSVREYTWLEDGEKLDGENEQLFQVTLNGKKYKPSVEFVQIGEKTAEYNLNFADLGVDIKLHMFLSKENILRMEVKEINETGDFLVRTLAFPEQSLVSVKDIDGGETASVLTTGDWNNIKEEFKTVDELKSGNYSKTYSVINDGKFAAAINNNVIEGGDRFVLGVQERAGYRKASLANGTFYYREDTVNGELQVEELPWSEIMIARDQNKDGDLDWQDAAILYRENMVPVKDSDNIRDSFSYIPFNIGGLAQSPFLRTADQVKKLSNYTDGFGQLILEKGYQGEGHDDVIADIGGHTGIRQGGKDELNKLIEIGKEYNAKVGVHVNVTEYHLDANELKVDNLKPGFQKGWGWKDESYYVDQRKDITTGELQRRFDMLKEDHPELAWIYIDVYTGNGWNAKELADVINDHGWMLATEFNGPLEQQATWTHWGGDPAYPNRGNESKLIRFIRNQEQDVYMADDLLKGAKHLLSGGWGNKHDIEGFYAIETFYNQILPTKYMQHFEILDWNDNGTEGHVKFTGGLEVRREGKMLNMYQDGHLISQTDKSTIDERGVGKSKSFIPWTWKQLGEEDENKVYHWNPEGGKSTWTIPKNFAGATSLKLYELSDSGRSLVGEVDVVDNEVTIDAKANTPYVLYVDEVDESRIDTWGEGTLIKDPGFDSDLISNNWVVESSSKTVDHVKRVNETFDGRNGNDVVIVDGKNDAVISQDIENLVPGKTYTASVWTKLFDDRKVTLGVDFGGEAYTTSIDKKTERTNAGQGVKWYRESATRMRVDFTVPEGVTTAKLYAKIDESDNAAKVLIDDFRIWTNPLELEKTNKDGYVVYENFENVDEGHGPFYMSSRLATDTRTHFAEDNPEKDQYMDWVIDGRFSLKTNQKADSTGEILVTDQSTMQLKPNTKYELGFKYTNKLSDLYSIAIKSPKGGELFNDTLVPGEVVGRPEDGPAYSREVKEFKKEFTTENFDDYYLTLMKGNKFDELILDDLYIKEIKDEQNTLATVTASVDKTELNAGTKAQITLSGALEDGTVADLTGASVKYTSSNRDVVTVDGEGVVTAIKGGSATIKAEVTLDGKSVTSNEITMTVSEKPEVKPSKVGNLSAGETTHNKVKLTWTEPENAKVLGYTIYKDGKVFATTDTTEIVVDGLKENTLYGFKVVANGANNLNSSAASLNVRTEKISVEKGLFTKMVDGIKDLFN
ncbi:MAG: endo-alpha-N-acetylgalactosaminidase family protein [Sarcina sp.]